jgi:hypothetical protein
MGDSDRASDRYEQCDPKPIHESWFRVVVDVLLSKGSVDAAVVHQIKDRHDGQIVYEVNTYSAIPFQAAQESIARDIASLTVDEFKSEYGIGNDPDEPVS